MCNDSGEGEKTLKHYFCEWPTFDGIKVSIFTLKNLRGIGCKRLKNYFSTKEFLK